MGRPPSGLPTVVFIYGGGYVAGPASEFDGEDLIRQSNRGMVVVIIQYRLGLFGFLAPGSAKHMSKYDTARLLPISSISYCSIFTASIASGTQALAFEVVFPLQLIFGQLPRKHSAKIEFVEGIENLPYAALQEIWLESVFYETISE
ncbi:Carboxylic ester hydrolase [Mycena venus]|uniref:Carboxylic ester hydrolase n=1 Tax=Mycena venus TaxID=2733690 RepID=A0A8H7CY96_9AGAR|nr:Carboxylic ester hydrolase [Mycena venus]